MKILFFGSAIYCLSFLVHIIVWGVRLPRAHTKTIVRIFLGTLIISLFTLWVTSRCYQRYASFIPHSGLEYVHICLFFISLTLAYLSFYTAVEADSPSLVMVMHISDAGGKGLDKGALREMANNDTLVKPRLTDLLNAKMVCRVDNRYRLTTSGLIFVSIFIFYRNLLKAEKGG